MTRISVAMATYNGERYLPAQLESILCQLGPDDELVVVDDASRDGTWALLQAAAQRDARLSLERQSSNQGVRATFSRALSRARHEIIFLADQDDVWLPGKRATVVAAFEEDRRCGLVISDARIVDADGRVSAESFMRTRGGFKGGLLSTLVRSRYLGCAMAMRRSICLAGLPIPSAAPMHDMWFGALAAMLGRVTFLPQPLLLYRRHASNASPSTRRGLRQMLQWRLVLAWLLLGRVARLRLDRLLATRGRPARGDV